MLCMLLGRVLVSVMSLSIRVVAMQRCERQNRPINLGQRQLRGDQLEVVTVADGSRPDGRSAEFVSWNPTSKLTMLACRRSLSAAPARSGQLLAAALTRDTGSATRSISTGRQW